MQVARTVQGYRGTVLVPWPPTSYDRGLGGTTCPRCYDISCNDVAWWVNTSETGPLTRAEARPAPIGLWLPSVSATVAF
ncbi:hypothetical protein Pmani_016194 [Petrolisthes manimaculis]|uniref:Uncharacterized protein n=1 Tax=Petrolisthes manimaculis TaxID=1843537 RepID=A0AAE1PS96_9EUCA|nr:hypothetical protein Pmani_016194 [Petrolisthes manimaculis]